MQHFHSAYIFRGQASVLKYTVAGATMILFRSKCDKLFLALYFASIHATRSCLIQNGLDQGIQLDTMRAKKGR